MMVGGGGGGGGGWYKSLCPTIDAQPFSSLGRLWDVSVCGGAGVITLREIYK